MPTDETRAAHAALVPVYVRAEGDAWALADTATDETLSTHDTARQALVAASKREDVQVLGKRANLREDGEPIGVWRWFDASAEEDESIGGSRITAESIWEMAASLNERRSAIPINGGGSVRGLGDSAPHGDAVTGGDHLANGFAHLGFPVIDETGRAHLFLRGELLPEIAAEFDLGRLAYGSIRFGFDEVDEADDYAVKGAVLISHALTNDPAVTTLTAGSERRRSSEHANVACRTRRSFMANKPAAQRGPIADVLAKIASMLGITTEQLEENPWAVSDAVYTLQNGAKVEEILEAADVEPAPAEGESEDEARARAVLRSLRAVREVEDVEPEAVDPMLEGFIAFGREVLGKPDAEPAEVLGELNSRKDEITAALAPETEPAAEGETAEEQRSRGALSRARQRADKAERELRAASAKVQRFETREWLEAEIDKRGIAVPKKQREQYLALAIEKGRDVVGLILDARNAPPTGSPLDDEEEPVAAPVSQCDAIALCEDEAAQVERARDPKVAPQIIYARAQRIAEKRWPTLFNQAPRATSAG